MLDTSTATNLVNTRPQAFAYGITHAEFKFIRPQFADTGSYDSPPITYNLQNDSG